VICPFGVFGGCFFIVIVGPEAGLVRAKIIKIGGFSGNLLNINKKGNTRVIMAFPFGGKGGGKVLEITSVKAGLQTIIYHIFC
jgi:hypothetical protein